MYTLQFYINYKSKNGRWERFVGAKYRFVSTTNHILAEGVTDKYGYTQRITTNKEEVVRIELLNLSSGRFVCPTYSIFKSFAKTSVGNKLYYVNVERHYFSARIVDEKNQNKVTNLYYEISSLDGEVLVSQRRLYNGYLTENIDSNGGPFPYSVDKQSIFNKITNSSQPVVKLKLINPIAPQAYSTTFYPRLIPIGADKKHRDIVLQTVVKNSEPNSNRSQTELSRLQETRNLTLYINSQPGVTYTVAREDGGIIYNPSLKETNSVTFQDGGTLEIKIPLKFKGNVIIKKNNKTLNKINIHKLDAQNYKSGEKAKDLSFALDTRFKEPKLDNAETKRSETDLMTYLLQMKSNAVESGMYTVNDLIYTVNAHTFKEIIAMVLTSYNFDHNIMPAISGTIDTTISEMERRRYIDKIIKPFFKGVYATINDAKDILFSIKSSRGKKILSFIHYVKTQSKMNIYLLKATADTKFLQYTLKTATTAAEHLKGSVKGSIVGFAVCAAAEIVEWWATDNGNIADLLGALVSTAIKAYIGAVACSIAITLVAAIPGVAVLVVVGIGLIVGVLVAMGLEQLDTKFQITAKIKAGMNIGLLVYGIWSRLLVESVIKISNISKVVASLLFVQYVYLFKVL